MSDHSDLSKIQFRDKMIAYEEQLRGDVMTVAGQWKQEGYDKGVVVGIEKGIERGALEKAKETAKNMLAKGYDINDIKELTGLPQSLIGELETAH